MNPDIPLRTNEVKESFFHLLAVLGKEESIKSDYLPCLIKWSIQLGVNVSDLYPLESASAELPNTQTDKMIALYHLVYMIYLDQVMEDRELEVASWYGEKLGFSKELVGDLFRSIATLRYDEQSLTDVRHEVEEFLKLHHH